MICNAGRAHATEYVRAIDTAKLYSIEQSMNDLRPHVLKYDNVLFYLTYHPDISIARRFAYTQAKTPLFFDFSLDAPELMKRQIFALLKYELEELHDVTNTR